MQLKGAVLYVMLGYLLNHYPFSFVHQYKVHF